MLFRSTSSPAVTSSSSAALSSALSGDFQSALSVVRVTATPLAPGDELSTAAHTTALIATGRRLQCRSTGTMISSDAGQVNERGANNFWKINLSINILSFFPRMKTIGAQLRTTRRLFRAQYAQYVKAVAPSSSSSSSSLSSPTNSAVPTTELDYLVRVMTHEMTTLCELVIH